jgi:hypothetical protein
VAQVFDAPALLYSGFRAYVDVPPARYRLSVSQIDGEVFRNFLGEIDLLR